MRRGVFVPHIWANTFHTNDLRLSRCRQTRKSFTATGWVKVVIWGEMIPIKCLAPDNKQPLNLLVTWELSSAHFLQVALIFDPVSFFVTASTTPEWETVIGVSFSKLDSVLSPPPVTKFSLLLCTRNIVLLSKSNAGQLVALMHSCVWN